MYDQAIRNFQIILSDILLHNFLVANEYNY